MKEKILEAFSNLGFKLEEKEGVSYSFYFEGLNMVYMYNENDEDFLNIAVPYVYEFEEDKTLQVCILVEKINSTLKYIKAYLLNNSLWLFYERELLGDEDLMAVIPRMILHLEAGNAFAQKAMAEIEETVANISDGQDGEEEACMEETTSGDDDEE